MESIMEKLWKTVLKIWILLILSQPAIKAVKENSWSSLNRSTIIINPVGLVSARHNYDTCGQWNKQTILHNGVNITCKSSCPSERQTYPNNQNATMVKTTIISNMYPKFFWADSCQNDCYIYNVTLQPYNRSTHALWLKPQLDGKRGTVMSLGEQHRSLWISLDISNSRLIFNYENGEYIYPNVNIPDNVWSHIAIQINYYINEGEYSLFVNGSLVSPVSTGFGQIVSRKKRDAPLRPGVPDVLLSVGITSSIFTPFVQLEVTQCINRGYSASVKLHCRSGSCGGYLETQLDLENTVFKDGHGQSVYKCPYDRDYVTLFACAWFLPAKGKHSSLLSVCKSFCNKFFTHCGGSDLSIPGLNSSVCSTLQDTNCIGKDYTPDFGIFKGAIKQYDVYNEILTNREIKALATASSLPTVAGMSNCLCPPDYPKIHPSDDLLCVKNVRPLPTQPRLGNDYHIVQYINDGDKSTSWISTPELQEVGIDLVFKYAVQVWGIIITLQRQPPLSQGNGRNQPMELLMLERVANKPTWKTVAVLSPTETLCNASFPIVRPRSIGCFVASNIKTVVDGRYQLTFDLLNGREKFFNATYMETELYHFLRSETLRIIFRGFPNDSTSNLAFGKYHEVNEVELIAREFAGEILCGCYAPGTDADKQCDKVTSQCPCRTVIGDPLKAGKKCEPYVSNVTPNYGPVSGSTYITLLGGYFGYGRIVVEAVYGKIVVEILDTYSNQTQIQARTRGINASAYDILNKPMQIILRLENGHIVHTGWNFTYMEDPIISNIYPRESFTRGGIEQTVVGEFLTSVYRPLMRVSVTNILASDTFYVSSNEACTVLNSTVMICPSPNFDQAIKQGFIVLSRKKRSISDELIVENKKATNEIQLLQRNRRQTLVSSINSDARQFYIGFILDGVQTYTNVSEKLPEIGIISIFYDPDIQAWSPNIKVFQPFKGEKHLIISGQNMDYGCKIKDYVITIGDMIAANVELVTNELIFSPPADPPELGSFHSSGNHRVVLSVGNIRLSIGYIDYWTGPLDDPAVLGAIIAVSVIAVIILILVFLYIIFWKIKGESPYQYVKSVRHQNVYTGRPGESTVQYPMEVPILNFMEQLKDINPGLYQNVIDVRIDADRMRQGHKIGKGNFGIVCEGEYNSRQGNKKVAIKTLKGGSNDIKGFEEFLEEATVMKDFDHENVLSLHGVVILQNTPYVLLPLMELGDLKDYVANPDNHFSVGELLGYGKQVAAGMAYLAGQKFVHRDLAARNCMINAEKVVKIADFGLARDIYEKDYYAVEDQRRPLPVKWMAIECLDTFKFSTKSDVWSFGVTLWELLMRGAKPYADIDNIDMKRVLLMGRRLPKPVFCPDSIYILMLDCWKDDPNDRPDFNAITKQMDNFFKETLEQPSQRRYDPPQINPPVLGPHDVPSMSPHDYLEMTAVSARSDDGLIPMNTAVPSDMPTSALLNNNRLNVNGSYADRYSRDPTSPMESGYIQPISGADSAYKNLDPSTRAGYTGPYAGILRTSNSELESPGYLEPVSLSQKDKSRNENNSVVDSENVQSSVDPASIDVNMNG